MNCVPPLPPLNSVHKHTVSAEVKPLYDMLHYDPKFSEPQFGVNTHVAVKYKSVDLSNHNVVEGLSCNKILYFPCHDVQNSAQPAKEEIIKRKILDEMYIPFGLDKNSVSTRMLEVASSMLDIITKISSNNPLYVNVLPLTLEITKTVEFPDLRLRLLAAICRLHCTSCPGFKKNYELAISRPRTSQEELQASQIETNIHSAVEFGMASLNRHDSSSKISCTICLEELAPGYTFTLPCHHIFHIDCLYKWQKKTRACPLCRYTPLLKVSSILINFHRVCSHITEDLDRRFL